MSNILITTSSFATETPDLLANFKSCGLNYILNPFKRKLTEDEIGILLQDHKPIALVAGVEPLTRAVLSHAPFLKVIARCGIGMDSVDLEAAKDLGIAVSNTPDAPTIPVAELTMGMILSLLRLIHVSDASIRAGGWERPKGALLNGKTVGLIGCGRIGTYLAGLLKAFGCRILGYDPFRTEHSIAELTPMERLLQESDIVSLHLPFSEANRHIMNAESIAMMKPGAILVNAARGGLIDESALVLALEERRLGGAALDCYENEPYVGPLSKTPNTLLTGHIGSYAREARALMEQQAVDNLLAALRGLGLIG